MRTPDEQTQNTNATKKLQRNTHTNRQKKQSKKQGLATLVNYKRLEKHKQHFTNERSAFCGNIRNMEKKY